MAVSHLTAYHACRGETRWSAGAHCAQNAQGPGVFPAQAARQRTSVILPLPEYTGLSLCLWKRMRTAEPPGRRRNMKPQHRGDFETMGPTSSAKDTMRHPGSSRECSALTSEFTVFLQKGCGELQGGPGSLFTVRWEGLTKTLDRQEGVSGRGRGAKAAPPLGAASSPQGNSPSQQGSQRPHEVRCLPSRWT